MSRKTVVTFNLPVDLVERMDQAIEKGQRSAFAARALEHALGRSPMSSGPGDPAVSTQSPAHARTSEESSRSSSEDREQLDSSRGHSPGRAVASIAKESASPGPARPGSGRGPRRSEDVKAEVKPRMKA